MVSTTTVIQTDFTDIFRKFVGGEKNADVRALREQAFAYFELVGFPTPRSEDWKYTNIAPIAKEHWDVAPYSQPSIGESWERLQDFDFQRNGLTALHLAFASDFILVVIPKDTSISEPTVLKFGGAKGVMTSPHVMVIAEPGSKATFIETYDSKAAGFTNAAVQVYVGDNANLTHYRVQKDVAEAFNYGVTEVSVGRGSYYNATNINLGGAIARHDIDLKFTAEGGEAHVDGLYMLNGSQHSDTHSVIDHLVPNCTSGQNYKGVLNDKSRAVFNGIVFVRENAHGTDAQQSNKNLLLSNEARIDTKPQLEIFNDDVKCSHGATVGQLEEEELFYLLTRGLPENLARNLLTYGFAEEIINKIGVESIKSALDDAVLSRLSTQLDA
jgi:Fe-S cluster assembly protein SufD